MARPQSFLNKISSCLLMCWLTCRSPKRPPCCRDDPRAKMVLCYVTCPRYHIFLLLWLTSHICLVPTQMLYVIITVFTPLNVELYQAEGTIWVLVCILSTKWTRICSVVQTRANDGNSTVFNETHINPPLRAVRT